MTLKTKTSLLITFSVVLAVTLSGILFLRQLEGSLRSSILETTRVASTSAAREISLKLHDNLRDTAAIAATLPQNALQRRDVATLQESLRTILALYPEFENGAWILDPSGVMLVDYPPATGVRGRSLNHRDYFQRTLASAEGVIGTPYVSIRTGEPVLTFTAPLKHADGALLGILACSVKLSSPHALGGIAQQRLGKNGYMYVTAADRTMLLHPDRERILKPAAPPGANALYDAAVAGYDGVGETVNSSDVAMLVSFSHIPETGWIVAAQQPTAEAFAPVVRARWWLLGALVAGIAVALLAASVVLRRATRNLKRIQQTLTDLALQAQNPHGNGNGLALLTSLERIPPGDEIGTLAKSFSTLYRELDRSLNWLRHSTSAWRRTFDAVHEGIVILDREHRLLQFNRAAARMLDIDPNDVSGHRCCGTVHRDNCSPQRCPAVRALEERTEIGGLLSISGEERLLDVVTTPLTDEQGEVIGTMHLLYDLTSQIAAEKRADRLLNFDPLTGLANRNNIRQLLREALSRAGLNHSQTGVLLLNLDHFSEVNESLGHVAGDALIKTAAERLLGQLPATATAGRLGGDEFIVILHDYDDDTAAATLVQKILTSFGHPFGIAEQVLFCTASIGIARYPQDGLDAASLLKSADIAMYHAKQHGRNTFRFFSSDMSSGALERLRLGTNLRHALDRNEFRLHFQPSVDLGSGRVVGFESLLRWNNLEFGEVSPDRFIPLAEENGLIIPIGNWVLQQACSQARSWLDAGLPLERIAVNLSGRQLKQDDLIACVAEVLEKSGLPPSVLELELTETVLMENPAAAASRLAELKELGLHLALDDFGTGYSSLNYLKSFPLDRLKIDRHFVRDLASRPDDASIVEVIIGIARALGMKVTAEGVETPEQLSFLREHQCDEVQGFLFSRALPEHEIPALFARRYNDLLDAEPPPPHGGSSLPS